MRAPRNEPPVGHLRTADDPAPEPTPPVFEPAMCEEPETDVGADDPRAWRIVDEHTPLDGTLIETKADGEAPDATMRYARYRVTRKRDFANRRWMVVGYWSDPITREAIPDEPKVWRMPDGFLLPGMVV